MQHKESLETLAKGIALVDSFDLNGLVAIEEQLQALCEHFTSDCLDELAHAGAAAIEIIEQIVMHETDDAEASLGSVRETVAYLQQSVNAISEGREIASVRPPASLDGTGTNSTSDSSETDLDLLFEWISSCGDALDECEASLLNLKLDPNPEALVAELCRRIHTIKGECGVLSLQVAQSLSHETESLIHAAIQSGQPLPDSTIFAFIDWFKEYIGVLSDDAQGESPPHADLLARLKAAGAELGYVGDGTESLSEQLDNQPLSTSRETDRAFTDESPVVFPEDKGMDENLTEFICEAREHLSNSEEAILKLEVDPDDAELIGTVFRAFHTIKGVAGFMNLEPIVQLAHVAETLLDQVRSGTVVLSSGYLDLILHSCDMLTQLIAMLEGGDPLSVGALTQMVSHLEDATTGKPIGEPKADSTRTDHPLGTILIEMGIASRDQVLEALDRQTDASKALQDLLANEDISNAGALSETLANDADCAEQICTHLMELGLVSQEKLDEALKQQREDGKRLGELLGLNVGELAPAMKEQRRLRRNDDELAATAETERGSGSSEQDAPATATNLTPQSGNPSALTSAAKAGPGTNTSAKRAAAQTVKVNIARMDNLVNMVGELVIAQQMVVQDTHVQNLTEQRTQRNLVHVGKIIRDLQEVSMSLRMVPVKGVFQKMSRLVRDISAKSGKTIQFHIEGEETELDRNVVDELADPLVHMIRNACDHGIETTDDRAATGKSTTGHVWLRAYHQGGSIVVEIEDDGRGLNRDKILTKAMERGVIASDRDPDDIPNAELHNLIFAPGFSTASTVTDLSGRGVGMDVVRRNIEALRGRVEIKSIQGKGSTFVMRLPLTMAIIDGMVVRVGTQRYVIPTLSIEQSFRPTEEDLYTVSGGRAEMVSIRGEMLPIHRLNKVFKLNEGHDEVNDALLIVLESSNGKCCLLVDEIIGQQQVVIKALGEGVGHLRGVSGGAILGDGRVALILDIGGLVVEATAIAA